MKGLRWQRELAEANPIDENRYFEAQIRIWYGNLQSFVLFEGFLGLGWALDGLRGSN